MVYFLRSPFFSTYLKALKKQFSWCLVMTVHYHPQLSRAALNLYQLHN